MLPVDKQSVVNVHTCLAKTLVPRIVYNSFISFLSLKFTFHRKKVGEKSFFIASIYHVNHKRFCTFMLLW